MPVDVETAVAGLSTIAALLCALWAFQSNRIAKKALDLSKQQQKNFEGEITSHLVRFGAYRPKNGNELLACTITFANKSHLKDSIVDVELVVYYTFEARRCNLVLIPLTIDKIPKYLSLQNPIAPPVTIEERGARLVTFVYEKPEILNNKQIDSYDFEATLASGAKALISSPNAPEIYVSSNSET